MLKKFQFLFVLVMVFSMILSACGAPAPEAEAPVAAAPVTVAPPTTEPPTAVPPTELPTPDAQALFTDLIADLTPETGYGSISAAKLNEALADKAPFMLDVREAADLEKDGYIEGAVNIPVRDVLNNLDKLPDLDAPIVVYCASGHRGAMTMAALKLLGYTDVKNLGGGFGAWKKASLAIATGKPADATAISTPIVADKPLYDMLNGFFTSMPDDFYVIGAAKLSEVLTGATLPTLIDVRTTAEWDKDGYIDGAISIPFNDFFANLDKVPADKNASVVVYCGSGHRGAMIMMALREMGYTNVVNLGGGLGAWKTAKLPVKGWVNWPTVWSDYLTAMPEGFYTIKAADLNTALVEKAPFLLDVREAAEVEKDGFIAGSVNIPVREVLANLDKLPALDQPIVIYCGSGHRGAMAMSALQLLGYKDVKNLAGGLGGWKKADLAVVTGEMPAAPVAGTAPEVDATALRDLNKFLSELPEGFFLVKPADLQVELTGTPVPVMIDLRTDEEWAAGYIEGSIHVKIQEVPANMDKLPADKAAPAVMLCQSGHRGAIVMMYLRMTGYTNIRNLAGGMNGWVAAEMPVTK